MSLVLHPQNSFTVVRQIANHLDTGTYYVRAVIRNAYTDEIIDTLDLEDKGSQRFKKNWRVPPDQTGQGFYVSIVTSVYADSGYTTKSENYGDEETTYLVQDRLSHRGGGGASIDYYRVRQIIKEEVEAIKPEPIDYDRITDHEPPADRTDEILAAIAAKEIPPPEKVNLEPVLARIDAVQEAIEAKEVTPPTDLSPVLDKLQESDGNNGIDLQEIKDTLAGIEDNIVGKVDDTIRSAIKETQFVSTFTTTAQPRHEREQKQAAEPLDIKKLAA